MAGCGDGENLVCVVNCSGDDTTLTSFLTELTGQAAVSVNSPIFWTVDNKYYSAELQLVPFNAGEGEGEGQWSKGWEGVVFVSDLSKHILVPKSDALDVVSRNWTVLEASTPGVCLLVGVVTPGTSPAHHQRALEWSVQHGFEMVEWEREAEKKEEEEEVEDDEAFPETVGVARVSEALQAHMWPVMAMKHQGKQKVSKEEISSTEARKGGEAVSADIQERETSAAAQEDRDNTTSQASKRIDKLLASGEELLATGVGMAEEDDPGGESFESLFSRFAEMKAHAQTLPDEERKAFAEKVVMSFWHAIGGDEDEDDN